MGQFVRELPHFIFRSQVSVNGVVSMGRCKTQRRTPFWIENKS